MMYKIHVYQCWHESEDFPWVVIRRENLLTGEFTHLREGVMSWPAAIVRTLLDVGVSAELYSITQDEISNMDWAAAIKVDSSYW
jgi:hypothetical protein